jgi:hypothetical protein
MNYNCLVTYSNADISTETSRFAKFIILNPPQYDTNLLRLLGIEVPQNTSDKSCWWDSLLNYSQFLIGKQEPG